MDIQKILKEFDWDTKDEEKINKMINILEEPEYYNYEIDEKERLDYIEYLEKMKKELYYWR